MRPSQASCRRGRTRKQRSGFTLIELMVSLVVMMIAVMGLLSLQTYTIRANSHARELAVATQIAQRWAERFKQDTNSWNLPLDQGGTLANTLYLNGVLASSNAFLRIPNTTLIASNAFNFHGDDVGNGVGGVVLDPGIHFCAAYRPTWVETGTAMRVDVRVWWRRTDAEFADGDPLMVDFPNCGDTITNTSLDDGGALVDKYHVVYMPSVVRFLPVNL